MREVQLSHRNLLRGRGWWVAGEASKFQRPDHDGELRLREGNSLARGHTGS